MVDALTDMYTISIIHNTVICILHCSSEYCGQGYQRHMFRPNFTLELGYLSQGYIVCALLDLPQTYSRLGGYATKIS